jgi:hypothetical protein
MKKVNAPEPVGSSNVLDNDWCHKFTPEGIIVRPHCNHNLNIKIETEVLPYLTAGNKYGKQWTAEKTDERWLKEMGKNHTFDCWEERKAIKKVEEEDPVSDWATPSDLGDQ